MVVGCPCPIQAYTHLDDHAPSILAHYKISSPLENYSCQYNSTIGGLMAVTESKISVKKTTTQQIGLNYRIQGKFSKYIRWGGSVVPTNEPPSRRATKLYNLD